MKKLVALCVVFAAMLYSAEALCRICFLADLDCQEGKFAVDNTRLCRDQNSSWVHEYEKCETIAYSLAVCNDTTGNYYEEQGCVSGYTDLSHDDKHICEVSLSCGKCCPDDKVKCKDKYQECTNNSTPESELGDAKCTDNEGNKYLKCICDKSKYPEQCNDYGIVGDNSDVCVGDNGTWYNLCQCAAGFYQTSLSNIKCSDSCPDNCRLGKSTLLPGTLSTYCWEGAECLPDDSEGKTDKCQLVYQSDFDNFWGGYDAVKGCNNLVVDCRTLGYDTGTAGTGLLCNDGTEPFRCPFDHSKVYCESGIRQDCEFITQSDCEIKYFGSTCVTGIRACYYPSYCKSGYSNTVDGCSNGASGNWSLGSKDEFGCAQCQCASTCKDKITVIPSNASEVTEECTSCGETKTIRVDYKCISGYKKEDNSCVKCNCVAPGPNDCIIEGPSDCDVYGNYEGCNSAPSYVETNEVCLKEMQDKYDACMAECYPELSCSSGYALSAASCGSADGWKLSSAQDSAGCFKCIAKTCADYTDPDARDPLGRAIQLSSSSITQNYLSRGSAGSFQTGNTKTTCYSNYECFSGITHGSDTNNDICGNVQTIINGVASAGCGVPGSGTQCESENGAGYYSVNKFKDISVVLNGKNFQGKCPETYCWKGMSGVNYHKYLENQGIKPDYVTLCVNGQFSDHC